jgi:FtsP/CotA-like multicopper oxidase with cupredoxin domain
MKVDVSRRAFLKTTLTAVLASGLPLLPHWSARAAANRKVREFRLSALPATVNLGLDPDFTAWTYSGRVPGPEIRVQESETIRVVLKNFLPEATTIHWHGVPVPYLMNGVPEVTQKAVNPGEIFVYEFEATPAGS